VDKFGTKPPWDWKRSGNHSLSANAGMGALARYRLGQKPE
jgi:hypothetical protein